MKSKITSNSSTNLWSGLNCWHNFNTKTTDTLRVNPDVEHYVECWARKALILCSNSFLTLSGTRAKKQKKIEHNCEWTRQTFVCFVYFICSTICQKICSIWCQVNSSLPLPLGVTPATKSSTVTFSIPFSLITSAKPNKQCYFTLEEYVELTRDYISTPYLCTTL